MAVYLCHEQPDLVEHDALVVDARPGRVRLDRSALHPGGGGQVSDEGWIEHDSGVVAITGIEPTESSDDLVWHVLGDTDLELTGTVVVRVDAQRRAGSPPCTPTRTSSTPSCSSAFPARW